MLRIAWDSSVCVTRVIRKFSLAFARLLQQYEKRTPFSLRKLSWLIDDRLGWLCLVVRVAFATVDGEY